MALILPEVNGSDGIWGTILNDCLNGMDARITTNTTAAETNATAITGLTNAITGLDNRLDDVEEAGTGGGGGFTVATSGTLPPVTVGQLTLETDTGYLSYGASIAGVPTRVPMPGSLVCKLRKTDAQSIASGTQDWVDWNVVSGDRLHGWSAGTPSKYTCTVPGAYEFDGGAAFVSNATGYRRISVFHKGLQYNATITTANAVNGTSTDLVLRPLLITLAVGDTVEMGCYHTAGAALGLEPNSPDGAVLNIKYLGYLGS
jgi:hypothetical protein